MGYLLFLMVWPAAIAVCIAGLWQCLRSDRRHCLSNASSSPVASSGFASWIGVFVAGAWLFAGMAASQFGGWRFIAAAIVNTLVLVSVLVAAIRPQSSSRPRTASALVGIAVTLGTIFGVWPTLLVLYRTLGPDPGHWPSATTGLSEAFGYGLQMLGLFGWLFLPVGFLMGLLARQRIGRGEEPLGPAV